MSSKTCLVFRAGLAAFSGCMRMVEGESILSAGTYELSLKPKTARTIVCAIAWFTTVAISPAQSAARDNPQLVRLSVPGGSLQAFISPNHGGEIAGLETLQNGHWQELLYRGMDYRPTTGWTGKAPILWPATGRNFPYAPGTANQNVLGWMFHGRFYPLAIHGFARDQAWSVLENRSCGGNADLKLALHDNPHTRQAYPFGFALTSEYVLAADTLYLRQTVRANAANTAPMPFSIGNHITFRVPLLPGATAQSTMISTPATRQILTDGSGRPTGSVIAADYARPRPLSSFKPRTSVSLSGYPVGRELVRIGDPSGLVVTVSHTEDRRPNGTPVLFNLWGDPGQGYFAPEPWLGKQNSLASGDGIISLSPGSSFHWTIAVRITRAGRAAGVARSNPNAPHGIFKQCPFGSLSGVEKP